MSNQSITYQVNLKVVGEDIVGQVTAQIEQMTEQTRKATKTFGDCFKALWSFRLVADEINNLKQSFDNLLIPGKDLNANMLELSAITGVTGEGLKSIEKAARDTAKTFGTSAVDNVESYKMMLSQLSPEIAKNAEAMKLMGENVNILSKQMGGDTIAATDVLNTSLNQFGVSMENPIAAAKVMTDMMNVMSAAAQNGSAELPQIKQALEQVGMVAKTTGLSFAETNAYIQLLDQAGKKGSEGGVALRNVLTTLSEGRFTSKLAADGLKEAGISVDYLADSSIPLHERLKTLRKIQGDTALMTKVFGKENMAAAIALINTADEAEAMSKAIVGTNSAVEQAQVIMGGYNEKMNRTKAWIDDLKIGFFNLIEGFAPAMQHFFSLANAMGQTIAVGNTLATILEYLKVKKLLVAVATKIKNMALLSNIKTMLSASVVGRFFASSLKAIRSGFLQATIATRGFSVAILNIPFIGWIAAAVLVVVGTIKMLWDNCKGFREVLFGIWEVAKAVFHNIGVFVSRLWNLILKPIGSFIFNFYKRIFVGIFNIGKAVIVGIGDFFSWLWNSVIKPVGQWIWNFISSVFMGIFNIGKNIWNWLITTFSGFFGWINSAIVQPIYTAFSQVWEWLSNLFNRIMEKLKNLIQPIVDLWNKLFSSEGTISVSTAYEEGKRKGTENWENDQAQKSGKPQEVTLVDDNHASIFDVSKGISTPTTPTIGGVAASSVKEKHSKGASEGGGTSKVQSLTIHKLVENLNIHTTNLKEGKQQITEQVKEILMTAVADFSVT